MSLRPVGIDLGTTYSAVAYLDDRGRTTMVRNAAGETLTPSVVFFSDQETVVGREAKKYLTLWPGAVAECVKRDMGEAVYNKPIRGKKIPPDVLQACILKQLAADVTAAVGPLCKAVITVPAYFDDRRRRATARAAEIAGIDLLDIVNEPTAAALAFGESAGYLAPSGAPHKPLKVLVYDLGGGTFDVTVIDLRAGEITTLATDGDVRLGGRDWDEALVNFVAERFRAQTGADPRQDPVALGELMLAVEEAKRTLSVRHKTAVAVRHAGQVRDIEVTVEQFEELTEPLLERTSLTTRQTIAAAGVSWDDIDRILLVGGSTRMPMVGRMLARLSGKTPDQSVHPDEAVARGAAIFAGYRLAQPASRDDADVFTDNIEFTEVDKDEEVSRHDETQFLSSSAADMAARQLEKIQSETEKRLGLDQRAGPALTPRAPARTAHVVRRPKRPQNLAAGAPTLTITDVNSHSLGIEGIHRKTDRKQNVVLIPRNTPLPARVSHHFVTKEEGQRTVVVQVLEGDNSDPHECARVGRAVLRDLPDRLPRGWPIEVVYEYRTNGRLAVYARVPRTDSKVTVEFEHDEGAQTKRVRLWRRVIEGNPGFDAFEEVLDEILRETDEQSARSPAKSGDVPATAEAHRVAPVTPDQLADHEPAESTAELAPPADVGDDLSTASAAAPIENRSRRRRLKRRNWTITIAGHIIAPILGLLIGYYVLALLTPRGNFLNLPLPGLQTTEGPDADR